MLTLARTPFSSRFPVGAGTAGERLGLRITVERRLAIAVSVALLLMICAILGAVLWLCDGRLIYSLDDPYISLSLGWHIAHGEYGINVGEAAAPASSILYPFVLAAFAWASWQDWVPLVVNGFAAIGTGLLLGAALCRYGIVTKAAGVARGTVVVVTLCLAINTVGLVFAGLEHSLHALTSVFVVLALARAFEEDKVPASLVAAIVLLPLLRFEGAALAGLTIIAFVIMGYWRPAIIALLGIVATLGGYMMAMHVLELPLLPSSVLTKSALLEQAIDGSPGPLELARLIVRNGLSNLNCGPAAFFLLFFPILVLAIVVMAHPVLRVLHRTTHDGKYKEPRQELVFACVVGGALIAQVVFGGQAIRYEGYTMGLGVAAAIVVWPRLISTIVKSKPLVIVGCIAITLLLNFGSIFATLTTPFGSRSIYEQQYQMHRFAVDFYRRPVGVNDLGEVSFRNPNYVLDLWGLGSEAARRARADGGFGAHQLAKLVAAKHVGLVMIYDEWFAGQIPPEWRRLAALRARHFLASNSAVTFYATSNDSVADALSALRLFNRDAAAGTSVTLFDDVTSP